MNDGPRAAAPARHVEQEDAAAAASLVGREPPPSASGRVFLLFTCASVDTNEYHSLYTVPRDERGDSKRDKKP